MRIAGMACWGARDESMDTLPAPAPVRDVFPKFCGCCGWPTTADEWRALPTRRLWPGLCLEIAECPNCPNTLAVMMEES